MPRCLQSTSACTPLPDEMWDIILAVFAEGHGIRAAKELRKVARVSRVFASAARTHPDNCSPGDAALAMCKLRRKARHHRRGEGGRG